MEKKTANKKTSFALALESSNSNSKSFRNKRKSYKRQDHSESTTSLLFKNTTNASYFDVEKNENNRKVFFTIFTNAKKDIWNKRNFYRAFLIANLFTYFLETDNHWRVPIRQITSKLQVAYKAVSPSVSNIYGETSKIYPRLTAEAKLDFLAFAAIENFFEKATSLNSAEAGKINELDLKIIMKDFGLSEIHDPVLDLAGKGYDKLRRRVFDLGKIAEKIFVNQVAAAELQSDELVFKASGLKKNEDNTRKFPMDPRRLHSSPMV